jgi:2-keto-3-deoxy-L-rhamnonate aldolase RhmA
MPQIEDVATLAVLDDFVKVPGIDAIAIGPNDMSGSAGVFRDPAHPTVVAAINEICRKASARGIPVCLGVNTAASAQRGWVAKGIRILTVAADVDLIASGARRALEETQAALK